MVQIRRVANQAMFGVFFLPYTCLPSSDLRSHTRSTHSLPDIHPLPVTIKLLLIGCHHLSRIRCRHLVPNPNQTSTTEPLNFAASYRSSRNDCIPSANHYFLSPCVLPAHRERIPVATPPQTTAVALPALIIFSHVCTSRHASLTPEYQRVKSTECDGFPMSYDDAAHRFNIKPIDLFAKTYSSDAFSLVVQDST